MSSLYLAVDFNNETKELLAKKQILLKQYSTGEWEDPSKFHITVKFLAEEQINANTALLAMKMFDEMYKPNKFEVIANGFRQFDHGVAWIGVDNSFPLYQIKYQIEECLRKCNFPLQPERFDGYTPHITMAYDFNNPNLGTINFQEPLPLIVDNLSLWASPKCNDTYITNCLYRSNFK